MKRAALMVAALALLLGGGQARATNLIVNGGFEDGGGSFIGWNVSGNTTFFGVDHEAHSGNWAAFFGAVGSPTYLMQQTVTTTPGATYTLDFWLRNDSGPSGPNSVIFTAQFGNTQLINLTDPQEFDYTEYTFANLVATGPTTTVTFSFQQNPSFFHFDDVSLTPVGGASIPEPSSLALLGMASVGLAGYFGRKSRKQVVTA